MKSLLLAAACGILAGLTVAVLYVVVAEWRERQSLEHDYSDLCMSTEVRDAIARYATTLQPPLDYRSVDRLISQLVAAGALDQKAADYVLRGKSRFVPRPDTQTVDPKWVLELLAQR